MGAVCAVYNADLSMFGTISVVAELGRASHDRCAFYPNDKYAPVENDESLASRVDLYDTVLRTLIRCDSTSAHQTYVARFRLSSSSTRARATSISTYYKSHHFSNLNRAGVNWQLPCGAQLGSTRRH
jgi:hypothetical protein